MATLDCVEVTTGANPRKAVIWLHGLGADGHDFEPIVPELRLPKETAVRFVFPHAKVRPVTINAGMAMRAWYDILSLDRHGKADEAGIRDSIAATEALVAAQLGQGLSAHDIVIAGFSQGGAIALSMALRYPLALAGVMGLSTYLPLQGSFEAEAASANRTLPVFMAHGSFDPVLTPDMGAQARDFLGMHGYSVAWHEYPMAHQVCAEEIDAVGRWLERVLNLNDAA